MRRYIVANRNLSKEQIIRINDLSFNTPLEDSTYMLPVFFPMASIFLTFGIYFFWVIPSLNKWVVEHTDFENDAKPEGDLV